MMRTVTTVALAAAMLSGCAGWQGGNAGVTASDDRERVLRQENERLRAELERRQLAMSDEVSAPTQPAPTPTPAAPTSSNAQGVQMSQIEGLPINARAGECYARVAIPPKFEMRTERQLVQAGGEKVEVIPARYEWVEERVLVKPAQEKVLEVVPARYRWVEERVLVKPASERVEVVEARYEWAEERVLVKPASQVWKPGRGSIEKVDNQTGEIMCLVEVPAEYKTVRKRVEVAPETTRRVPVPAEYETVRRQELVAEAQVRKQTIPAEYKTVRVQKLVQPAREVRTRVEPKYETVERPVKVSDGSMQWRSVLCEVNATRDTIVRIQQALAREGYDPGKIDGVLGPSTLRAVKRFQDDRKLATGGVTIETVRRLGLDV